MASPAFHRHVKSIRCAHHRTVPERGPACRDLAPDMEGDEPVAFLHQGFFLHVGGPAVGNFLFRRLEQEPDGHRQLVLHGCQHLRSPQQDGDMGIMAAGMHGSRVLGFVRRIPQFRNGQGIDVRPDPDDPVRGMGSLQGGDHPGFAGFHIGDPQRIQIGFNGLLGLEFFPGPFRFFMKMAAQPDQFRLKGCHPFFYVHHKVSFSAGNPISLGLRGFSAPYYFLALGSNHRPLLFFFMYSWNSADL